MGGPVHGVVEENHRRRNVEDLLAESPPRVEDGVMSGTGHGVLSIGAHGVGDDTLLLGATCKFEIVSSVSAMVNVGKSIGSV